MDAIAHTFGARGMYPLLAGCGFSVAIAPATLSRPNQDIGQIAEAKAAGMTGLLMDLSTYSHTLSSTAMLSTLRDWLPAMKSTAGFIGVWMSDLDLLSQDAQSVLSVCRENGVWTAASFTAYAENLTALCENLNAAAKPFYKYWGGDGPAEATVEQDGKTITSMWAAFGSALPANVERWPILQGFYDRKWGTASVNQPPSLTNLNTVWTALTNVGQNDESYVVFGLSAFPGTQRRYLAFGQEPSYADAVGLFNGARRGRVYISPSYSLVRRGETRTLTCSVSGVEWALVSAPMGCEISQAGVFRAGNEDGEVVVSASKSGYYDEARLIVFKEP